MNTRLLRRIQKHITEEPNRFQMIGWKYQDEPGSEFLGDLDDPIKVPRCGTVACIGGWAEILSKTEDATSALKIGHMQAERLFNLSLWPEKYKNKYDAAKKQSTLTQIASERIDHFVATKGAE